MSEQPIIDPSTGARVTGHLHLKPLDSPEEYEGVVRLQKAIWGFSETELYPARLFVVTNKVGGQIFGAFDGSRMVAFLLAVPAVKPGGHVFLHSHMLGVLPEYRNSGLGRRLKLMQRDDALSRGIHLVEWTFDPLELKNAYLNIERLGAVIQRFVLNQYGFSTSALHGALPTDRCIAEWRLSSERVTRLLAGDPEARPVEKARIVVPADIGHLRRHDPARAREIQHRVSEEFLEHLRAGLAVTGFERDAEAGVYLLSQCQPD